MDVMHARCAGLDVHKQTEVACVRVTTAGRAQYEVRTFATTAAGLLALHAWLGAAGCTHAVLESTGVYWKPMWHMLEEHLALAALPGHVRPHHRVLLQQHLRVVATLQATIAALDAAIAAALAPYRTAVDHLVTLPGVSTTAAQSLVAEIGTDMSRVPSAGHLISWAGLCPRQDASAGKHRSTRIRKGAPWLKPVLVQGASAAVRGREGYLRAQFLRLKPRRGAKKAILAVAASMLGACYYMLRDGVAYRDLGADHFARHDKLKTLGRLVRRLHDLGYEVELKQVA